MPKAKSSKPKNLQEAKIQVREAVGKVAKDAKQSYRDYKYVSHEAVTAAVVPAMHKVGMTHTPSCVSAEMHDGIAMVHMKVSFQLVNDWVDENDSESTHVYTADKIKDGTSMGAIISYGIKTALLKYFGLESGDPDLEELQSPKANAASKPKMETAAPPSPALSTVDIFSGTEMAKAEDMKRFMELCNEAGVTSDQLDARLASGGYSDMDNVPQAVMVEWIERLEAANG
jgi:hypothetical protein